MNKLHPGARWQFRIGGYLIFGILGIFFAIWIILPLAGLSLLLIDSESILPVILLSVFGYFLFVIVVSEIYARMSYDRYLYEVSNDAIKIERGIIWKKYTYIPYERVQNVDIRRGIIARMLGFSSVIIQTAGFSGPAGAEGNIPAVEVNKAEEIRSFVMKKITSRRK